MDQRWTGRHVLVTGAGGFIGSHLAERLVQSGATTRALVRYHSGGTRGWLEHSALKSEMDIVFGDVRDRDSVARAMRGVDVVFHLAALIGIPYSYETPDAYLRTNVEGTMNLLQVARQAGVRRFVQTSTSEVYGSARYVPIDEDHPLQGQSPYSASKIAADKFAESFHCAFGLPVVIVRPFNTFGPRQSARAVIPTIVSQALAGSAIRLGSLEPRRDFTFVQDTVEGFVRLGAAEEAVGQVVHLGTGRDVSISELAGLIQGVCGVQVPVVSEEDRQRPARSEVERLRADPAKAKRLAGWEPRTTLEQGLAETVEWMRAHLGRFQPSAYAI